MADDGVTSSNVISGLIGGAAGATLAFLGSWGLVKRAEGRIRQARLHAIEGELRGNKLLIESVLNSGNPPGEPSRDIWDKTDIDLAMDTSQRTYHALQSFYWLFNDAISCWGRINEGSASEQDEKNFRFWLDLCLAAQALVTGELHLLWRIRGTSIIWAKNIAAWLKRRTPWIKNTDVL